MRGQRPSLALLQLATPTRCLLVRVGQMGGALPTRLSQVLEGRQVLKVGRGIAYDAKMLRSVGCDVSATVELQGRESLKDLAREASRPRHADVPPLS